jgi:hypothetical protein
MLKKSVNSAGNKIPLHAKKLKKHLTVKEQITRITVSTKEFLKVQKPL